MQNKAKNAKNKHEGFAAMEADQKDHYYCMTLANYFYSDIVNNIREVNKDYKYALEGEDMVYTFINNQPENIFTGSGSAYYNKKQSKLVVWWMLMSVNFMNAYKGKSTRYMHIDWE